MNNSHVIIIHLGPVQDFIMAARRTRDLWFGSWLLSELAKAAALQIVEENGGNVKCLVFPAPQDLAQLKHADFRCSNKIVATVPYSKGLGEKVRQAILDRLWDISSAAFAQVRGDFDQENAKNQILEMPEIFWVTHPVNGDYKVAREYAENLMAARKATRNFEPVTWGGPEFKSSLDGLRESVIPESSYRKSDETRLWLDYGLRRGERLYGVGLLKRRGESKGADSFPSTSHIAAQPLLAKLENRRATEQYINTLNKLKREEVSLGSTPITHPVFGNHDGHILFEDRLQEFISDPLDLEDAKEGLRNFLREALDGQGPIPYYALLKADGDSMGQIISQLPVDKHRVFSLQLSRFAEKVEAVVTDHSGALIFAGADDVIAFLPLHTALDCAIYLARMFREEMSGLGPDDNTPPTLSAGMAICHNLEPLSNVVDLATRAESIAKQVDGKDALAISLNKRGGVPLVVKGKWDLLTQRLHEFIQLYAARALPHGVAYELRDLALRFQSNENHKGIPQILRLEAVRILGRKDFREGDGLESEQAIALLQRYAVDEQISIKQLADELIVARNLAEAYLQSGKLQTPGRGR